MEQDWRKFEEALVDAFRANAFKPRRSNWQNSDHDETVTGDWVVHIEVPEKDEVGNPCLVIVETINITSLAKSLAAFMGDKR